ncbi:hypothetical protein [Bradyrhizobium paxllaeri]|uniref:hypothetical protein n=1 Tax=Bradyrhizobium paxllaeri TaxID=190148 RepID=UPI0008108AFE|nr:hypothetical protein [Bradyrhizobium paxllaeri]
MLDHLDDQSLASPASLPSEELQRLEKELHDELHGRGDNHPIQSFSFDPEQSTFDLEQFSPGELRRLLDAEPAQLEVDHLARQSPIDDWSTTSRSQWAPQPAYLPAQSVSQSNPPSWDKNFEAYTSGPVDQSSYDPGPLPNLSSYLPLEWQHGAQWAPEDLKEGMRLHNVLPGASQPETNLTLKGVKYTATIGSSESEVFLHPTE